MHALADSTVGNTANGSGIPVIVIAGCATGTGVSVCVRGCVTVCVSVCVWEGVCGCVWVCLSVRGRVYV